jgi:argininosuccinate synthase
MGMVGSSQVSLIGALEAGGAEAIASRGTGSGDDLLDRAAMEAGTD